MKIRRKQRQKSNHVVMWVVVVALASVCFLGYWGVQGVLAMMDEWLEDLPSISDYNFNDVAEESIMYASDGTTVLAEFQLENRDPLDSLDEISEYVIMATIDTEDVRFYSHNGVDLTGVLRALINNLTGGDLEGASTITQQLVRNTLLADEADDISIKRKVREMELALEMEEAYTKDEILLMYLNTINYGQGCYGIEAAAQYYYSCSASELTLAQAATLVGIPQSPTYLNPVDYPEACLERRNTVLARMLAEGDITQEEYDAAVAEDLNLNLAEDDSDNGIYLYPYFTSYVRELLLADDSEYGITYSDLFTGGLTIYTTLDVDMQEAAEEACETQLESMDDDLDVALVAIDPDTGYVLAMVGGKDYSESQVNLATGSGGSGRMAGSTFKAFTLAAAIEAGIDPETLIDASSPLVLSDGETEVENFNGTSYGVMTIAEALARSSNTAFVRLSQYIGAAAVEEMAERLGIPEDAVSAYEAVTLGSSAVTPLQMAAAYAVFASGGIKNDVVVVTKIVDSDGNVIYEAGDTSQRVLTEEVAAAVTSVLRGVFEETYGTAYGYGPTNGQVVAGKTGTSENNADHWLVGYSPTLVCAIWIGNPEGSIETDSSVNCKQVFQDFMSAALADTELVDFPDVDDPSYDNEFNESQAELYADDDPEDAESTVGMLLADALTTLADYTVTTSEEYSDTVTAGYVISQTVVDDTIALVVSLGPDTSTTTEEEVTVEVQTDTSTSDTSASTETTDSSSTESSDSDSSSTESSDSDESSTDTEVEVEVEVTVEGDGG